MCWLVVVGLNNNSNKAKSEFQVGGQRWLRTYLKEDGNPTEMSKDTVKMRRVTELTVRSIAHPARARPGNRFPGRESF